MGHEENIDDADFYAIGPGVQLNLGTEGRPVNIYM